MLVTCRSSIEHVETKSSGNWWDIFRRTSSWRRKTWVCLVAAVFFDRAVCVWKEERGFWSLDQEVGAMESFLGWKKAGAKLQGFWVWGLQSWGYSWQPTETGSNSTLWSFPPFALSALILLCYNAFPFCSVWDDPCWDPERIAFLCKFMRVPKNKAGLFTWQ